MADFGGMVLTTRGLNLLAKAQTGTPLNITRVAAGAGVWVDGTNAEAVTALVDERLSVPIQSMTVPGDGTVKLTVIVSNSGLEEGFIFRELGVFATDPDLGEILYAVAYSGDRYDYLPASATAVEKVLDIYIVVGGAQNVTATINPGAVLALKSDIEDHEAADPAHSASKIGFDNSTAKFTLARDRVQDALEALATTWRQALSGDMDFYVSIAGSDDNDGLSVTSPFRTIDHAISIVASRYSLGDNIVTIHVAAGTYGEALFLRQYQSGYGYVQIVCDSIASTIIQSPASGATIQSKGLSGVYKLQNVTLKSPNYSEAMCYAIAISAGDLSIENVSVVGGNNSLDRLIQATDSGVLNILGGCSFSATLCGVFINIAKGIVRVHADLAINGACSVNIYCFSGALFERSTTVLPVISGEVTGQRYTAIGNGVISTSGGGASYFPGSTDGTTSSGGQYI